MNNLPAYTRVALVFQSVYCYGMLLFLSGFLGWNICFHLSRPSGYRGDPYANSVVTLMLLFNHLTFMFKWRLWIAIALYILSASWTVFAIYYIGSLVK